MKTNHLDNSLAIPELLAPAGDMECLKFAIAYGTDAVYIASKRFGLRAFADNFDIPGMQEALEYAHHRGVRVYVAMNIFAHNQDMDGLEEYVRFLSEVGVDAVIVSDPGVLDTVRNTAPGMDLHLSTQANTTNWRSAAFWHRHGVKRIILSRELSIEEIRHIRQNTPLTLQFECFVHGAMCISYSGRCALSNYLVARDSNRGECAQPCRWKYFLVEEKRPGEYMPVFEDSKGTYILNSKDLCMLGHIEHLIRSGVNSFKIEGRMKSAYYVATVVQAYRRELDAYARDPKGYRFDESMMHEISKTSHRGFTTGFFFNSPTAQDHEYSTSGYVRSYDFVGIVLEYYPQSGMMLVEQRNHFSVGEQLEIMRPGQSNLEYTVTHICDEYNNPLDAARHPQQKVLMPVGFPLEMYSILRRAKKL